MAAGFLRRAAARFERQGVRRRRNTCNPVAANEHAREASNPRPPDPKKLTEASTSPESRPKPRRSRRSSGPPERTDPEIFRQFSTNIQCHPLVDRADERCRQPREKSEPELLGGPPGAGRTAATTARGASAGPGTRSHPARRLVETVCSGNAGGIALRVRSSAYRNS